MSRFRAVLLTGLLLFAATPTFAASEKDEARARALFSEVRCVQCQSESIADSDAPIAGDLRRQIRTQIAEGRSDAEIRKDLFATYGDYVLFRPRLSLGNLLLWLLPPLIAILGGIFLWVTRKKVEITESYNLSADEEKTLREILKKRAKES